MTARSAAPPFGTGVPTDGAGSTIWTGSAHFQLMLNTLIDLRLEENLRNPLPWLLPGNFRPASLVSAKGSPKKLSKADLEAQIIATPVPWGRTQ